MKFELALTYGAGVLEAPGGPAPPHVPTPTALRDESPLS
eukprot:CAMPEP_0205907410 /NCGR_PEP_ID=MMETSP1325-20131115/2532_1 /ASSEMBLY_ACC=CAM_ASM_000708 /TAXON_ID=236786 /ORGANISM="Florenciella sp., Strain RCC1007" /LENGTH=38 /DNA_ID= /DNA_START= /DNA_END= /DNA_ORIENTATION=